MSIAY